MSLEPSTLRDRIAYWIGQGYMAVSETPSSAQLVRRRHFNPVEFIAMPIYLVEYLGQRDRTVYLAVEADGTVSERGTGTQTSRYQRLLGLPLLERLGVVAAVLVLFVIVALALRAVTGT